MILQVRAFARLHFGLMEISPGQPHCYGGVGMMIDTPTMIVQGTVRNPLDTHAVSCEGDPYWSDRTQRVLEIWQQRHAPDPIPFESFRVVEPPLAHIGLGSGTQWACSIAGLLRLAGRLGDLSSTNHSSNTASIWEELFESAERLAIDAGRGLRSHIGCEGFRRGGLIVDWGQDPTGNRGAMRERTQVVTFPEHWRVVTFCDRSYEGESGGLEASMFERCSAQANPFRNEMIQTIREQMVPAIAASDWVAASDAIGRYGERAGRIFEPMQGGVYRSSAIAECIHYLRGQGICGAGQSSWGPTVFAIARDCEQADWIARQWKNHSPRETLVGIAGVAPSAAYECDSSS
jgi:beta-RFAP synthase